MTEPAVLRCRSTIRRTICAMSYVLLTIVAVSGCSDGGAGTIASSLSECECRPDAAEDSACVIESSARCVIPQAELRYFVQASEVLVTGGTADFDVYDGSAFTLADGEATELIVDKSSIVIDGGTVVRGHLGSDADLSMVGGIVGSLEVLADVPSTVTVAGGTIYDLTIVTASSAFLYEGMVARMELQSQASASINGGRVPFLELLGEARAEVTAGVVDRAQVGVSAKLVVDGGDVETLSAGGRGDVHIGSGRVESLHAAEHATVFINGGSIGRIMALATDSAVQESVITVVGSDFNHPYGRFEGVGVLRLIGTLDDGSPMDAAIVMQGLAVLELCEPDDACATAAGE